MNRFLIEAPHEGTAEACDQAIRTFLAAGSHFMTHADWGCSDGEHKAWIVVDVESKDDALHILPLMYRQSAKITKLEKFSINDVDKKLVKHHN